MLKLRTGNHVLAVETFRHRNRKEFNERICNLCDKNKIQDLYHMLIECSYFQELREKELEFLPKGSKYELYNELNIISSGKIKILVRFMDVVENKIK